MYVHKRDYYGKQTNDEKTMEKQAILFPARDKNMLRTYMNYVILKNKLYAVLLKMNNFEGINKEST